MARSRDVPRTFHLLPKDGSNINKKKKKKGKTSKSRCFIQQLENVHKKVNNDLNKYVNNVWDDCTKTGNRKEAIEFVKEVVRGCKCEWYPNCGYCYANGESFSCNVSFEKISSDKPTMIISYQHCYHGGSLHSGRITVIAHDLEVESLQDVLLSCGLERLSLSKLARFSSYNLFSFGRRLAAAKSLKILEIDSTVTRDVAFMLALILKETNTLEILDLSNKVKNNHEGDVLQEIANMLRDGFCNNRSTLRHLCLHKCKSPRTLVAILNGLNENPYPPSLQVLHFTRSKFYNEGTENVLNALGTMLQKESSKLRTLNLRALFPGSESNDIGSIDISPIANALRTNSSLVNLDVSVNYLDSIGMKLLMESLKVNTTLEKIEMEGMRNGSYGSPNVGLPDGFYSNNSSLASMGWQYLFKGLADTAGLKELNLNGNDIDPDAMHFLAEFLSQDRHTLRELHLSHMFDENFVKEIKSLFRALKFNKSLCVLDFSYNKCFNSETMEELVSSLSTNSTLEEISLKSCRIDRDLLLTFADHLPKMHGLKKVDLNFNNIDRDVAEAFLAGVQEQSSSGLVTIRMAVSAGAVPGRVWYDYSDFDDIFERIQFFMKLNRYRAMFRKSPSLASYLMLDEGNAQDLPSFLFCFLKEKYIELEEL